MTIVVYSMRIYPIAELVIVEINAEIKNYHNIWNKTNLYRTYKLIK